MEIYQAKKKLFQYQTNYQYCFQYNRSVDFLLGRGSIAVKI